MWCTATFVCEKGCCCLQEDQMTHTDLCSLLSYPCYSKRSSKASPAPPSDIPDALFFFSFWSLNYWGALKLKRGKQANPLQCQSSDPRQRTVLSLFLELPMLLSFPYHPFSSSTYESASTGETPLFSHSSCCQPLRFSLLNPQLLQNRRLGWVALASCRSFWFYKGQNTHLQWDTRRFSAFSQTKNL